MGKGWIRLHRKIQNHWLYQEKRKFSRFEAWIDLLLMVNHEDTKVVLGNEIIDVKRGQRITSIRQLCDRWGWSNTKVTKFLRLLEDDGMVTVKNDAKKTLITIENYDFYQSDENEKTTQKRQKNDTETTQKHTNKNDKNEKNDKKDIYTAADIYAREESIGGVPTTENAQLSDGSVGQIPGDSSQEDYERIKNLYMQLAGKGGFDVSPKDEMAIYELLQTGIDVDKALVWLKECFDNYKPKHKRDKINSFSYCVPYILDKHYAEKEGAKVAEIRQPSRSYGGFAKESKTKEQVYRELEAARRAWGG